MLKNIPCPLYLTVALACRVIISHVRYLDYGIEGPSCLNITQRREETHSTILVHMGDCEMVGLFTGMDNMDEKVAQEKI